MPISEFIYTILLKPKLLKQAVNWVIKKIIPECIQIGNATVYINPDDPVISGALFFRVYENDEITFFNKYFQTGMVFVDIGANVGLYTALALSHKNKPETILCIEPHTESRYFLYQTIEANHSKESHVIVSSKAVSDTEGLSHFYENKENKGDNRLYADPLLTQSSADIATTTLDTLCKQNDITCVQFVKIDVQGLEFNVLKGAKEVIGNSEHCILISEFWPYGVSQSGNEPELYYELLGELGFKLFLLQSRGRLAEFKVDDIAKYHHREYINIVGFKGLYTP